MLKVPRVHKVTLVLKVILVLKVLKVLKELKERRERRAPRVSAHRRRHTAQRSHAMTHTQRRCARAVSLSQ